MHHFKHITTLLAATAACTNAAPQAQVSASSFTTTLSPIIIPDGKIGAAAFVDEFDSTLIVYQAQDTSINSVEGKGPPLPGSNYTSSIVVAAGIARDDTPLALAVEGGLNPTVSNNFRQLTTPNRSPCLLSTTTLLTSYPLPSTGPSILLESRRVQRGQLPIPEN